VRRGTTLGGQSDTWLWLALAAALLVLIVLLALWIAAQGRGRTGLFASVDGHAGGSSGDRDARGRDTRDRDTSDPDPRLNAGDGDAGDGGAAGSVVITAAAVEQALKAALLERTDLAGASVSTWEVRGVPGLRVRVFPRKGVPPYVTAAEVSRLVEALDVVTGYRTPVLISIRSGARVRFTRAERVT
jgi:hypothetical protein